ncbi:hypothetical protein FE257_008453 [Aspergillus nanangensis]|uniref:MARVEL domain-containing protein n=1 Tax=Aspergillus nanangensis TaxID=2582783 RepID=A0AAD4CLF9_ASPNN|nr:hypothetical protein FE257_008453 [Aspergillus nanangensis]
MRSKSVKPSAYPPLPFHLIRFAGFLSSLIVAIILAVFIYNLHKENHKLPFAFLVLIVTSILSLLNYVLTSITHCCHGLSPRLSMTCNTILIILWIISLGLLCWCMSNTILTTCNATYWATSTGITVCRIYKTLFSFTVLGTVAHIAAVALDVVVNRRQNRLGVYDPMGSNTALNDYKMHDRNSSIMSSGAAPAPHPADDPSTPLYAHHRHQPSEDFYDVPDPADRRGRGPAPIYGANSNLEQYHAGEAQMYADTAPARGGQPPRVRFSAYDYDGYAQHPTERTTGYDPGAYR